jgi:hypothetical protein
MFPAHAPRRTICGLIALALACLALVACNPYPRRVMRLTGTEFRPRPQDYPIAVTENNYETPYIALAAVTTKPYNINEIDTAGPQQLRQMARELGGDAVVRMSRNAMVVEEVDYRPGEVLKVGTRFEDKYTLSGIVVRFKREDEATAKQ